MNHYQLLGIPRQASRDEIRAAYLHLARELHPDRHVGAESAAAGREKFLRIQAAYEVLRDPEKRRLYDLEYREIPPLRTQPATSHGAATASTPGVTPGRRRDVPEGWVRGSRRSAKFLTFAKSLATLVVVLMMLFAIVPRIGRALWPPQEPEIPSLLVEEAARRNQAAKMSSRVRPDSEGDAIRKTKLTRQSPVVDEATDVDETPRSDDKPLDLDVQEDTSLDKKEFKQGVDEATRSIRREYDFESGREATTRWLSPVGEATVGSPLPAQPRLPGMAFPPLEAPSAMGDVGSTPVFPQDSSSRAIPTSLPAVPESSLGGLSDSPVFPPVDESRLPPRRRSRSAIDRNFQPFQRDAYAPPSSAKGSLAFGSPFVSNRSGRLPGIGANEPLASPRGLPSGDIQTQPLSTAISQTEQLLGDQRSMSTGQQSGIRSVPDFTGDSWLGSGIGVGSFSGRSAPGGASRAGVTGADWGRGMTPESRTGLGNGRWSTPSVGGAMSSPWGRSNAGQTFPNADRFPRTNQLLQQRP